MARRLCGEEHYLEAVLAVAGFGLPGTTRSFPREPLDDESWGALLDAARAHRVTGLLRAATDQHKIPATEEQAEQARTVHRAIAMRVLSLELELVALVDHLTGWGIETRVLKGSAVARLDHQHPGLRSFIDLDVLIRPADFDRAVRALRTADFTRTLAEPRPGFDRRFDKGTTLLSPAGYELDLHRTFVLGPWGVRVDLDDLWHGSEAFIVGHAALSALPRPARFLHACYHAALGNWPLRLGSLRDVAEMLRHPGHDHETILELARSWGVEAIIATAVADTHRLLGLPVNGEFALWATRYIPSPREEAWLALYAHSEKTFAAQALATVPALPRLRDKAAYLRALAFPDPQYTAGRHSSAAGRFRYALREIRRGHTVER